MSVNLFKTDFSEKGLLQEFMVTAAKIQNRREYLF